MEAYQCANCNEPMEVERAGAFLLCCDCEKKENRIKVKRMISVSILVAMLCIVAFIVNYFSESSIFDRNINNSKFICEKIINNEVITINNYDYINNEEIRKNYSEMNNKLYKAYHLMDAQNRDKIAEQIVYNELIPKFFVKNQLKLSNVDFILKSINNNNIKWIGADDFVELMKKSILNGNNQMNTDIILEKKLDEYFKGKTEEKINICQTIDVISYIKLTKFANDVDSCKKINDQNYILLKYIYNSFNRYDDLVKSINRSKYINNFNTLYDLIKNPIKHIDYAPRYKEVPQELIDELNEKNNKMQKFIYSGEMYPNSDLEASMRAIAAFREYRYGLNTTIAQAYHEALSDSIKETKNKIKEIETDIINCKKIYNEYLENNEYRWNLIKNELKNNEIHEMQ